MNNSQLIRSAAAFAREINDQWSTATQAIYETSRLLNEARLALKPGHADTPEWLDFKRRLPFGDSVLKKLMVIGGYTPLQKPSLQKRLPPNYTIIYEVTQLDPKDELPLALQNNEIHPRMRRQDFIQWRSELRATDHAPKSKTSAKINVTQAFASISAKDDISTNDFALLHRSLEKLSNKHDLTITFGRQAKEIKGRVKEETLESLRLELSQQVVRTSNDIPHDEMDLLESTAFQMRGYQDIKDRRSKDESLKRMIYDPTDPVSIEHPDHPYSLRKWDNNSFFKYLFDRKIVTQWTPAEHLKGFGDLEMLARTVALLESNSSTVRENHLRKLRNVARRKSANAPHAKRMLSLIESVI